MQGTAWQRGTATTKLELATLYDTRRQARATRLSTNSLLAVTVRHSHCESHRCTCNTRTKNAPRSQPEYLTAVLQIFRYSFKYNQQDVTLYNILYCCQCCTCFRRFPLPSSRAHKLYTQHLVYVNSPTLAVAASKLDIYQMLYVQIQLLMMGGKTIWNMYRIDSNKEYCITLHLVGFKGIH